MNSFKYGFCSLSYVVTDGITKGMPRISDRLLTESSSKLPLAALPTSINGAINIAKSAASSNTALKRPYEDAGDDSSDSDILPPSNKRRRQTVAQDYVPPPAAKTVPTPSQQPARIITDPLSIEGRKTVFLQSSTTDKTLKKTLDRIVNDMERKLDPDRTDDDCHFDPLPPKEDGGSGAHQRAIRLKINGTFKNINVHYGIIAIIVHGSLTDSEKDGWIYSAWHLSHLCGNWTCCNSHHHVVESGPTNINRNWCFNSSAPCYHHPPCMKDKKVQLPLIPRVSYTIGQAIFALKGKPNLDYASDSAKHFITTILAKPDSLYCFFCDDKRKMATSHFCPVLKDLQKCSWLLHTLRNYPQKSKEMEKAVEYLVLLKQDLERVKGMRGRPLDRWVVRSGRKVLAARSKG